MKKKLIYNPTYLILSLIAVNIISYFLFIRIDLTSNKKYSLSPVSKTMIKKIDKDISVTLFMSEGLTPDKIKLGREFRHLLKEYKTISNKAFTINTIIPNNSDKEALAEQLGIEPMAQEIAERDMVKIQKVYFGAVIQIGNKKETINILPTTALEYEVTRRLKEACDTTKPTIGFLRGHNEMLRQKTQLIEHELSHSAKIESMRIDQFTDLNDYKVICIVGPKESFSKEELVRLGQYLEQGGRLYIALNHAVGQISYSQNNGFINRVGIEDMLEEFGLKINYDFVVDNYCGRILVTQDQGFLQLQSDRHFPYIPIIQNFSSHVITKGLNAMLLQFASSITNVKTTSAYTFTPLAKSSSISGVQKVPVFFDIYKTWTRKHDFNQPNNTVAALLSNEDNNSAIVVITDADFMEDKFFDPFYISNINFAVNSIEWLADDSGLIKLRNKYIENQSLKVVSDSYRRFLKYTNFFLPIMLVLLIGLYQYREYKRAVEVLIEKGTKLGDMELLSDSDKEEFVRLGLTEKTHYLASTGIQGQIADSRSLVLLDAYAVDGLQAEQIRFLHAPEYLNPTYEYGVTFERGTAVEYGDRKHIFISGTASIDNRGEVVYPGNIAGQTRRMLLNIEALLKEAGSSLADLAKMIVYLRDIADYPIVRDLMEQQFPDVPKVIVLAPVCRPGWLIETECIAIKAGGNPEFRNL